MIYLVVTDVTMFFARDFVEWLSQALYLGSPLVGTCEQVKSLDSPSRYLDTEYAHAKQ